jgi:xylulokinase
MTEALLTFDLGTTRLKVAAFAPDGSLLGQESVRHREHRDARGTYQDPDEWWSDACRLTRDLLRREGLEPVEVLGVSLSGRGGAGVFIDAAGEVVAPPWFGRPHDEELRALVEWRKGGAFLPNYGAALMAKLLWLRNHEPDRAAEIAHALYAKDFLLYRLTGEAVTDWTSGPDGPAWDPRALAHTGIADTLLPRPALPWEIAGDVTREAASALGIPEGTPVAVGAHDGICANVGAGAGRLGAYAITLGTHAVVRAITAHHPEGAYRFYILPPDRHVIGGNAVMAGRAVDWLLDCFGYPEEDRRAVFSRMDARAGAVPVGARGVRFLPFLAGQVAPEARPGATAVFAGLAASHGQAEMYRAVLEGAAFAVRAIFEQVRGWCGKPDVVRLTGSGAQSEVWSGILADALGVDLEISDAAVEGRGAAMCLAVALGIQPDIDTAARVMAQIQRRREPDIARDAYDDAYAKWRALADATRPLDRSPPDV